MALAHLAYTTCAFCAEGLHFSVLHIRYLVRVCVSLCPSVCLLPAILALHGSRRAHERYQRIQNYANLKIPETTAFESEKLPRSPTELCGPTHRLAVRMRILYARRG